MARFSRYPVGQIAVSSLMVAIIAGAAFEFHQQQSGSTHAPPLQMSLSSSGLRSSTPVVKTDSPVSKPVVSTTPVSMPGPLITQTPTTLTKPQVVVNSAVPTTPSNAPVVTPVSTSTAVPAAAVIASTTPGVTQARVPTPPTPSPSFSSNPVLADAAIKSNAGDLLGARDVLNAALISGKLSATDTDTVKKQMSALNQTLIFSPKQFPKDPLSGVYTVKSGDHLSTIGNVHQVPYELLLPLNRMTDAKKLRYGQSLKVVNGPFDVVISKSKFTMDVYLGGTGGPGSTYVTTYPVGLGTDNSTPTGTWSIKNKVPHPTYFPPEGHNGAVLEPGNPQNPLGDYWLGLEGTDGSAVGQRSYGIHGTIDPSSIGKQSSMGCIRLRNEDVEVVYKMLMQGKSVVVVKD